MSTAPVRPSRKLLLFAGALLSAVCCAGWPAIVAALHNDEEASKEGSEQEVVIKREVLKLTDPRTYRVLMSLEGIRHVELTAPVDGIVRTVTAKPGQKLKAQGDAIRLDDTRANLILKRARANLQAAQLEKKQASNAALAEARLEAAQSDVDLAQYDAEQLVVRAPFNGEIQRVYVVEGQFVRAGEKLATLIDTSRLAVEVPVERSAAAVGSNVEIKVEGTAVKGRVESVTALAPRFDALRELTVSPASAVVTLDNASGKLAAGQTVFSDLVPLSPVAVVPSNCVSNLPEGDRKVQVLRDRVVRDLPVKILAKVGTESVFVSGRFNEGDEVIVKASRELADGTPLRALAAGSNSAAGGAGKSSATQPGGAKPAAGGKKPAAGF
jgi:multidrug efflux pump subunit AcrA (membrane-fusion protein)